MIRLVHADAVGAMRAAAGRWPAVFTGLPDAAEVGLDVDAWRVWYLDAIDAAMGSIAARGAIVVYATDRRTGGGIESKAQMILNAAADNGLKALWHRIAVFTHGTSLRRPSYTHLLAFGRGVTAGKPRPDVFDMGPKDYPNALGHTAMEVGLDLLARVPGVTQIVDPFVGRGSILATAWAEYDLDGLGFEIDRDQVDRALASFADRAIPAAEVHPLDAL